MEKKQENKTKKKTNVAINKIILNKKKRRQEFHIQLKVKNKRAVTTESRIKNITKIKKITYAQQL